MATPVGVVSNVLTRVIMYPPGPPGTGRGTGAGADCVVRRIAVDAGWTTVRVAHVWSGGRCADDGVQG